MGNLNHLLFGMILNLNIRLLHTSRLLRHKISQKIFKSPSRYVLAALISTSCNVRRAKFEFYVPKYAIYKYSTFVWSFCSLWPWRSTQRHWLNFLSHLIILWQKNTWKIILDAVILYLSLISFQRVNGSNLLFPIIVHAFN